MLERVSERSWTLGRSLPGVVMGFLVALCIAIAPKPSCTRVENDPSALVQKAREPSAREQAIEDELAIAEGTISGYIDADVARFEAARRASLLDDTGQYRDRIDRLRHVYR